MITIIIIIIIIIIIRNQQTETSQELFFNVLEQEMRKIEQFTKKQVREIRYIYNTHMYSINQ